MTISRLPAALALVLVAPAPALAHTDGETVPADGATVAPPERVTLRFDDPMRITAVTLTGEGGEVPLASGQGTDAVTEWAGAPEVTLAPGPYEVEWRGLSSDGHVMEGRFAFTVAE